MGPAGLKGTQVLQGVGSPSGDPAGYHVVALLGCDSVDASKRRHTPTARPCSATSRTSRMIQFNERLA
jgi:hypothetical protein